MVSIEVGGALAVAVGALGALWIYLDGRERGLETADMWAVGFFIGMFIPPLLGAVAVGAVYVDRRYRGGGGHRPTGDRR